MRSQFKFLPVYLIAFLFLGGCENPRKRFQKEQAMRYLESKIEFGHLVDHFPPTLDNYQQSSTTFPAGAFAYGMAKMFLTVKSDSAEIEDMERKLLRVGAIKVDYQDSSFIIIGDTLDYTHISNAIPIPSFESYEQEFGLNSVRLDSLYTIFIIESKKGEFMDDEYLTNNTNLPEEWKNGFTRGVAIDHYDPKILYWMAVW